MITEQPKKTSKEAGDPALQADLDRIASLKAELNVLKAEAAGKSNEITATEKELGVTAWDKFSEKMKPVRTALTTAAAKAKPAVLSAADMVSEKANTLLGRNKEKDGAHGDTPEEPKESDASETNTKTEDTPTKVPQDKEMTPEQLQLRNKIFVLKEELGDIQRQITNKESQIAWLEKKAGLSGGPLKKMSIAMEPHVAQMKHNLDVAKVKTGEQLAKAKVRSKQLWASLAASTKKLKTSLSEKYNSSTSKSPADKKEDEDMFQRYA